MHEHSALNSQEIQNADTLCITSDRKRKNNTMETSVVAKHLRSNYYALLDCNNNCDQESLKAFEKHVQESKDKCQATKPPNAANQNKPQRTVGSLMKAK